MKLMFKGKVIPTVKPGKEDESESGIELNSQPDFNHDTLMSGQ